jgi:hypothetical protein
MIVAVGLLVAALALGGMLAARQPPTQDVAGFVRAADAACARFGARALAAATGPRDAGIAATAERYGALRQELHALPQPVDAGPELDGFYTALDDLVELARRNDEARRVDGQPPSDDAARLTASLHQAAGDLGLQECGAI